MQFLNCVDIVTTRAVSDAWRVASGIKYSLVARGEACIDQQPLGKARRRLVVILFHQTDLSGHCRLPYTLPHADYSLESSEYRLQYYTAEEPNTRSAAGCAPRYITVLPADEHRALPHLLY